MGFGLEGRFMSQGYQFSSELYGIVMVVINLLNVTFLQVYSKFQPKKEFKMLLVWLTLSGKVQNLDSSWRSTLCIPFQIQGHTASKNLLRPVTKLTLVYLQNGISQLHHLDKLHVMDLVVL